jgi:diguanylate cyclase (GGDEF)-like protein
MSITLWLKYRGLREKLFVIYLLMFLLPAVYLLYIIWELVGQVGGTDELSFSILSLKIGVPAAFAMSLAAFLLMNYSLRSLEDVARNAESFLHELHGEQATPVTVADEAEKISSCVSGMISELRQKLNDVDKYAKELYENNRQLVELAVNDGLTGLYNQKHIKHLLAIEVERSMRFGHPLAVLMLDVDNFKGFNDGFGHLSGDKVLLTIARVVRSSIRTVDMAARYGGEEFMVLLPEINESEASQIAEKIRQGVAAVPFETDKPEQTAHLTISIGGSVCRQSNLTPAQLVAQADANLYQAKQTGKNCVRF